MLEHVMYVCIVVNWIKLLHVRLVKYTLQCVVNGDTICHTTVDTYYAILLPEHE